MKGLDGLKVVQVECGGMHTVALTSDGKVSLYMFLYAWGLLHNGPFAVP